MPNIKSAIKRVKVTETKNLRNRKIKTGVRTACKKFDAAVVSNDKDNASKLYAEAVGAVDKAVLKGVMHKNTASRSKSRMAVRLNKINA